MTELFDQETRRILDEAAHIHRALDEQRAAFDDIEARAAATQRLTDDIAERAAVLDGQTKQALAALEVRPHRAALVAVIWMMLSAATIAVAGPSVPVALICLGWMFFGATVGILLLRD